MTKSELRRIFTEKRKLCTLDEINAASAKIADVIMISVAWTNVRKVSIFLTSVGRKEVETEFVIKRLRDDFPHIEIYAPRVDFSQQKVQNIRWHAGTPTRLNKWHIPEPIGSQTVAPQELDVVITPLLAFDEKGFRVGYGGGFYDRLFNECRPATIRVGVSLFPPVERISDRETFDVALNSCATPDEFYQFQDK